MKTLLKMWSSVIIAGILFVGLMLWDREYCIAGIAVLTAYAYLYGTDNAIIFIVLGLGVVGVRNGLSSDILQHVMVLFICVSFICGFLFDYIAWLNRPRVLQFTICLVYLWIVICTVCVANYLVSILDKSLVAYDQYLAAMFACGWAALGLSAGFLLDRWV